jgi:WD40 repeat protein
VTRPISPGFVGALVAFSPEGTSVAVGSDADAQVFDVITGQPLLASLAPGAVGIGIGGASVSFDEIDETVAFGRRDGSTTEFDLAVGTPVGGSGGEVGVAVAIGTTEPGDSGPTTDDQVVVVSGQDLPTPAHVFHVASDLWESSPTGNLVPNMAGPMLGTTLGAGQPSEYRPSVGAVAEIAVSADEQMVAVAGGGLALLDMGGVDASARQVFVGEASDPWTAVGERVWLPSALAGGFRPDGAVAVASFVQTFEQDVDVRTMAIDLATGRALAPPLSGVAQYVDPERLLRGNAVDAGVLLDTVTIDGGELIAPEDAGVVGTPRFAYDEARTALGLISADGSVRVFTGDVDELAATTVAVTGAPIVGVAVSRNGQLLAVTTGSEDRTLSIYDVESGEPLVDGLELGQPLDAPVAFDADGKVLAVAAGDGTVLLLDPTTGQPMADPIAVQGGVLTLAFSPDGSELAVGRTWIGDVRSTVSRWTLAGAEVGAPLPLGRRDPSWLAYDPSGGRLLVGANDGNVLLWSFDRAQLEEAACRVAGRNLTQEEWTRELPGEDYRESCPAEG